MIRRNDKFPVKLSLILFFFAGLLHMIKFTDYYASAFSFLVANAIFFGILIGWAINIQRSVLSKKSRWLLISLALLTIFYIFLRTCKYRCVPESETARRYLWYLYYIPQIFGPLIAFVISSYVGKTDEYKLSKKYIFLFVVAAAFALGILTNDLHFLAFRFNTVFSNEANDYDRGPLFIIAMVWIYFWLFASVGVLTYKCKAVNKRKAWIPVFWLLLGTAYILWVALGNFWEASKPFNIPETQCFIFIAMLESCIQIGLLPSNMRYGEYISKSSSSVQLIDNYSNVVYSSETAIPLTREHMKFAKKEPVFIDANTLLQSDTVYGGNIFWTVDFTVVNEMICELSEIGESLSEKSALLRAENEIKEQMARIAEQNRLYDTIASHVKPQLDKIAQLIENETDFDRNMSLVCVLNCYIKRRANLSLLADCAEVLDSGELYLSIKESVEYLKLCGVYASVCVEGSFPLSSEAVLLGFDLWQFCAEMTLPRPSAIMANLLYSTDDFIMKITVDGIENFVCAEEYIKQSKLLQGTFNVITEDCTCFVTLTIPKGGIKS